MPITVAIDGQRISVEKGTTILQAAGTLGIRIPTLCHNDAVEPYAACRVCLVEASDGKGWFKTVTACNYEVWDGLHVDTRSEQVVEARRVVLDLMLSAHPGSAVVREMAAAYGVAEPSYPGEPGDDCILCGLCVRVCDRIVGVTALGFSQRGAARRMDTPFGGPSPTCIGCGSCVYVCPTRCLHMEEDGAVRVLYKQTRDNVLKQFDLLPCSACGKPFIPKEQLAHVRKQFDLPKKLLQTCSSCGGPKL